MNQQQLMLVILVVAVVLALAVVIAAAVTIRDRRSYRLRPRYGPDYDRTDADVRRAEAALPVAPSEPAPAPETQAATEPTAEAPPRRAGWWSRRFGNGE